MVAKKWLVWFILYAVALITLSSIPSKSLIKLDLLIGYDKLAHVLLYIPFGILAFHTFKQNLPLALMLIIVFGFFDEQYQRIIPGRDSDFLDWGSDVIGALFGFVSAFLLSKKKFDA